MSAQILSNILVAPIMMRLTTIDLSTLLRDMRLAISLCNFAITTGSMEEMASILETEEIIHV
jgi:hypothetical protein